VYLVVKTKFCTNEVRVVAQASNVSPIRGVGLQDSKSTR
jgi:hypothetical protein